MLPRIKKAEIRNVHINEDVVEDNFFLHSNGFETTENTKTAGTEQLARMLVHDPDAVVFGTGFREKAGVDPEVHDMARKQKVEVHVLDTPKALEKFLELSRNGKKTVAHIHVGE